MTKNISELDIIYISYDEPNCEENYAKLLDVAPWAKRVHGVKGSDAAHKAAARLSETARFISVDADNVVDPSFFDQEIDFDHVKFKDKVISWSAKNIINGLEYGNGGLKCWPVDYVLNMKSHEEAEDDTHKVDFCWDNGYVQMNNCYCETINNASALQAWRAGFREGVKMTLDRGKKVSGNIKDKIWWGNYHRLLIWMSVGEDVENGLWAIYGARLGCYMTNCTDWDFVNVRDFEWLTKFFYEDSKKFFTNERDTKVCKKSNIQYSEDLLRIEIKRLGEEIQNKLGISVGNLDSSSSKFFKEVYVGLPRTGNYITEEDLNQLRKINK